MQQSMSKYIKQNKYILLIWIFVYMLLGLLFCVVNSLEIKTNSVISDAHNFNVRQVTFYNHKFIDLRKDNVFKFEVTRNIPEPLIIKKIDASPNPAIQIKQISIIGILGLPSINFSVDIHSSLHDILKISNLVNTTINPSKSVSSNLLSKLCAVCIIALVLSVLIIFISITIGKILKFINFTIIPYLYKNTNQIEKLYLYTCYILVFITTLIAIWSCFAGVLFGDDGFFYLMSKYPTDLKVAVTMYFEFSKLLYSLSGGNIAVFRLMSLLISLPVVYLFSFTITFVLQNIFGEKFNKHNKNLLLILLFVSSMFLCLHHTAPDYNTLSRVIIFVQLAIIVVVYLRNSKNKYSSWLILCLGFITGINFFIKFSSSISSLFVILIFFTIYCREKLFVHVFKFLLGIIISLLLYFTFIQNYDTFIKLFYNGVLYNKLTGGHNVMFLLLQNFYDIFIFMFKQIFVIGLYFILRKYFNKDYLITYVIFIIGVILIIGAINSLLSIRDLNNYLMNVSFELLTIFIIIVFENICSYKQMSLLTKNKALKVHSITAISLIFLYVASVGTDTQIFYHIMFQAPIIIFIIVLQWRLFDNTDQNTHNLLIMLVAFCCVVVVNGLMYQSPRYANLLDQNTKYEIDGHNLYIDSTTNDSLLQLQKALYSCGFKSGDYISGYYYLPDIIFATGGRSPVTPIYWTTKNEAKTLIANQFLNSMMESSVLHSRFILLADVGNFNELSLGTNYIKCGSIKLGSDSQLFYYKNYLLLKAY